MINSITFWIVLATSVVIFWMLPSRLRMGFLAAVSFGYLASLDWFSVLALLAWSLLFYWLANRAANELPPSRGRMLLFLILGIVSFLAAFKYIPPLVNALAPGMVLGPVLIPLGISYYTFKLIHYAVEVSRGNITNRSLSHYFAYMFLFPIFTAGPIERMDHFLREQEHTVTSEMMAAGLTRLIHGLVKKMILADLVVREVLMRNATAGDLLVNLPGLETYKAWGFLFLWFLYAYLEFSAYSDIAIGASRLYGLRIMENFNWPIIASDIGNFWKRWHMTLAGWCQTYVYMPLIGLTRNPYLATMTAFLVIGVWHGGTWGWVSWGLFHGAGVATFVWWTQWKRRRKIKIPDILPLRLIGTGCTLAFVSAAGALPAVDGAGGNPWDAVRVFAKLLFFELPPWQ